MGEVVSAGHRVDAEGLVGPQKVPPLYLLHFFIKLVGVLGEEGLEGLQHLQAGAHIVVETVHHLLVAFADDGAVHHFDVFGAQVPDFGGKHFLQSSHGLGNELVVVFHGMKIFAKIGIFKWFFS